MLPAPHASATLRDDAADELLQRLPLCIGTRDESGAAAGLEELALPTGRR